MPKLDKTEMIKAYQNILLVHCHDDRELSRAVLEIERAAFLDGYYFSFAIRSCKAGKRPKTGMDLFLSNKKVRMRSVLSIRPGAFCLCGDSHSAVFQPKFSRQPRSHFSGLK
jgi:predicted metal-binding protein